MNKFVESTFVSYFIFNEFKIDYGNALALPMKYFSI